MSNLINPLTAWNNTVNFIRSPITEMVCAFIIDISRTYIFAFIHQFTGDQLIYLILQYMIIFIPWIMLGHGALRHEASKYRGKSYSDLKNFNSSNILMPKKSVKLISLLFAALGFLQFFHLYHNAFNIFNDIGSPCFSGKSPFFSFICDTCRFVKK